MDRALAVSVKRQVSRGIYGVELGISHIKGWIA
jgi:hypothetical protein